jgi:cyclic pyranopterin phosphate synthase
MQTTRAKMVDVGQKPSTLRTATAGGTIRMQTATLRAIHEKRLVKGDVLTVAQVAGIQAAKRVSDLIPLCHPLPLTSVELDLQPEENVSDGLSALRITATVKTVAQTGVEMEALTAVCVSALTVYDMCKGIDREMEIGQVRLLEKTGGRSGDYRRDP